ncbi:MAG: hypothetical protein IPI37_02675 [Bacteroidales bacterium]|nr:hypothetical protein [Bacteroidales bacterium]
MHSLIVDFVKGAKPRAPEEISLELNLPVRTVHECLDQLHGASMVTEVWNDEQEKICLPAGH